MSTGVSVTAKRELDPSLREFPYPDFGFVDELNNRGQITSIWALVFDHVGQYPKYERLRNYIRRQTAAKLQEYKRKMAAEEIKEHQAGQASRKNSRKNQGKLDIGLQGSFTLQDNDPDLTPDLSAPATPPYERMFKDGKLGPGRDMCMDDDDQNVGAKQGYDYQVLERLFMNQMGKDKSPEEIELMKLEKVANPITGEKGKRISSKNMREIWISLQELMKETNANQTKFRKVKREWHL